MARILLKVVVVLGFFAMAAALFAVVRTSGFFDGDTSTTASVSFVDVPQNYRHRPQIEAAVKRDLIEPASPTRFGIEVPVTRQEFAVAIVKAMGWSVGADENEVFADIEGTPGKVDPADYVAVVAQKNVMSGTAGDVPKFRPNDPVTIEQAIRVIVRAGGGRLKQPEVPDAAIATLIVSEELKKALQVSKESKLLDNTGITAGATDFSKPLTKELASVLFANLEKAFSGV